MCWSRAMTWRRRACRWTRWSVRKGRIVDGHSRTPLQSAAAYEQLEIVQYLVKSCTTVDLIGQTNSSGYNSLHYAAEYSKKNVQMLQFLIDNYNGDIKEIINQKNNGEMDTIRLCI